MRKVTAMEPSPPRGTSRPTPFLRLGLAALTGVLVLAGSILVPLPLVTIHPGPAPDAAALIEIDAPTFSSKGSLHVTTVTLFDATLVESVGGWLSPAISVVPRSLIYPPGLSEEQVHQENASEMDTSKLAATVAALRELGHDLPPDGALVASTAEGMPAARDLRAGDVIVAVDGEPVRGPEEARARIEGHGRGEAVKLGVRRSGSVLEVWVPVARAGRPERSVIGVRLQPSFALPFRVAIDSGGIGGPSAGLTFALAIVDLLDPPDLTGGRRIAETGTIDFEGRVGPVGGIPQKVRAAERIRAQVLLVPSEQLAEARAAAEGRILVVGVSTLAEAVRALRERGTGAGA